MKNVKSLAIAAAITAFAATSAFAGGMAEPIMTMEPAMVMDESAGSSSGLLVPLILIALIGIALSQSGTDTPPIIIDFPQPV